MQAARGYPGRTGMALEELLRWMRAPPGEEMSTGAEVGLLIVADAIDSLRRGRL